jgi:hypothetical protein
MKKNIGMIVDRIEDDLAVLVMSDDEKVKLNLPVNRLPKGVKSGDHLKVTFEIDRESADEVATEIEDLLDKLKRKKIEGSEKPSDK